MNEKLKASKMVHISLTLDEWKQFYAYAHIKGFGIVNPVGTFAKNAMVAAIARNAPTEAQEKRIEEIIDNLK
jgi:hypothetical protein